MSNMQPAFGDRASASDTEGRIDAIAWAVFFIWIGIAMLMEVPWGWFLVGVGVLALAAQLFHWQMDNKVDRFWIACGLVFLAGGVWMLFHIQWPLAPILIILLGLFLLSIDQRPRRSVVMEPSCVVSYKLAVTIRSRDC